MSNKRNMTRQNFLVGVFRAACAGALAAFGIFSVFRYNRKKDDSNCINNNICDRCEKFISCGHPRAVSAREIMKGEGNG